MCIPCYKNRGKIGESVQLPCNLANSPFLLAAASLGTRSSSLNHVSREASKEGDDGAGPGCDQVGSPCGEPRGEATAVVPLPMEMALTVADREMAVAEAVAG